MTPESKPELKSDCTRCASLCCMGLTFARDDGFAIDKPAGAPCPNLTMQGLCGIYDEREATGYAGCVRFECFGAGQRVTQELFGGRSWREDPAMILPMMDAFALMRGVHDVLVLIAEGRKLSLTEAETDDVNRIEQQMNPPEGWTAGTLKAAASAEAHRHIVTILRAAYARSTAYPQTHRSDTKTIPFASGE